MIRRGMQHELPLLCINLDRNIYPCQKKKEKEILRACLLTKNKEKYLLLR